MDNRSALASTHSLPPQRAVSGSYALQQQSLRRMPLPSRLVNVRSTSQPVPPASFTHDPSPSDRRKVAAVVGNPDHFCRSPEVIDLDDDAEDSDGGNQRPTKRARTDGDASVRTINDTADLAHEALPGSPLPSLPKQRVLVAKDALQRDSRTRQEQATRKAHGLEAPAVATRLPSPKNTADFAPWNGHHPEDVLNETVIKAGYFDKAPGANSTECHSAKLTIWPNLSQKNNMGLQTLNYLFTSVLEKRLALGKATAPSTFKPPPRVTVTDTKREAWLRDLANSDIPLRKQSRTIPHGIRGKLLMEQCLGKGISMPRAVWLAKCVGANELRAFRRKGVSGTTAASGESKWIREWTIHVEQFFEGVIASCGQPGWRAKMDYAVKLATSFYSEHLLERDHYLDWIVSSFADTTMDRIPIWIILVQLYWKDIIAFTKRGRRLAEATLAFLHQISQQSTAQTSNGLRSRLHRLIIVLAVTNRGCLVLPRTWEKYKDLLAPGIAPAHTSPTSESPAQNVATRNERLIAPTVKTPKNTRCPLLRLYSMLDAVNTDVKIDKIAALSLSIIPDSFALVQAILDWAASLFRTGRSRIDLTTKLIVRLRGDGYNTDDAVLDFLHGNSSTAIDARNVHAIIAELVRVDSFSTSRYFSWLITSGALSGRKSSELGTGLLSALPVDALPPHLHNTRQMLVRRLSRPTDDGKLISDTESKLSDLLRRSDPAFREYLDRLDLLSCSTLSTITRRIITKARGWSKDGILSLQTFCDLRDLTERSLDTTALSDLVELALPVDDMVFLASIIDTINKHARCFAAIGHLTELSNLAIARYRILRSQQSLERTLILALKSLVRQLPNRASLALFLDDDLAICDQQSSMAVCSPASDNLVSMQASSLDSDEDIDAVFASGNTMDEQLMQRVFARIIQRTSRLGMTAVHAPSKICEWWNQLRAVDASGFEQLVQHYLRSGLSNMDNNKGFNGVISTLVASTCVMFSSVLQLAEEISSPQAALTVLTALLSDADISVGLHASEVYRYRLQLKRTQSECANQIVPLLVTALDNPEFALSMRAVSDLLNQSLADGNKQVLRAIVDAVKTSSSYLRNCGQLITKSLHLDLPEDATPGMPNIRMIVRQADPLSVEHCAAALQFHSKIGSLSNAEDKDRLQQAVLETIADGSQVWPQLLEGAGSSIMTAIYEWSREKVLASVLNQHADEAGVDNEEMRRQLDVLDITHYAAKEDDHSQILAALTEKLKLLETQLSTAGTESDPVLPTSGFLSSLGVILHLTILYSTFTGSDVESFKQYQGHLLAALCNLLVHPRLQRHTSHLEYIYDVAASLSDVLPDMALHSLARTLPHDSKDLRIVSLLGISASPDAWLALVSQIQAPGSQQQRILMKQASNQQQTPPPQQQQQQQQTQTQTQTHIPGRQPPSSATPKCGPVRSGTNTIGDGVPKIVPYPLRRWEIMSDATPTVGENDTSLSLGLFGARKV